MKSGNIRLHLVHGTWAKGLFGRSRAWSESGSLVQAQLKSKLPPNTHLESFIWSGRNSIAARNDAATELREHLRQSLEMHPSDCHVVLAHSHGGTIACNAVRGCHLDGEIGGVICLATPFVYLVSPSLNRLLAGVVALASLLFAIVWSILLSFVPKVFDSLDLTAFASLTAGVETCFIVGLALFAKKQFEATALAPNPGGPKLAPFILFRSAGDEASLLLAMGKLFDVLCASITSAFDMTQASVRRPMSWVAYLLALMGCTAVGMAIAMQLNALRVLQLNGDELFILGRFVYPAAVAGGIFLLGSAVVAFGAGHWNLLQWLSSVVEVETAPPNTSCELYVFDGLNQPSLRHSMYLDARVQRQVSNVIQRMTDAKSL